MNSRSLESKPRRVLPAVLRVARRAIDLAMLLAVAAVLFVAIRAKDELSPARPMPASDLPARIGTVDTTNGWRFAVLGDREDERPIFRACLARARAEGCLFVVLTGNLVRYGTELGYALLMCDLRDFGYAERVATVRGSHDPPWLHRGYFLDSDWTFEFGGVRFIGIDNAREDLRASTLDVVEANLRRPHSGPLIVFVHKPAFSIHPPLPENEPEVSAPKVQAIAEAEIESGNDRLRRLCTETGVAYVFAAHLDIYDRQQFGGVTQIVSGTAGGRSDKRFDSYGFVVVDVRGANAEARRVEIEAPSSSPASWLEILGLAVLAQLREGPVPLLGVLVSMLLSRRFLRRAEEKSCGATRT